MAKLVKDGWATRFGLIMAMAGNAVGLGNFLRFPGKAAPWGGAFMIPYFLALVLIGIPLMWMEWTIGRHGGFYGHGSTPGHFHRLWKHSISKYLGIFGVLLPAMIGVYYVYIESWSLGYAWMTVRGTYWGQTELDQMAGTFTGYLGMPGEGSTSPFSFSGQAYLFFLITFAINIFVFGRGISRGIEIVAKFCMPVLLLLGAVLAVRVLTLPEINGRSISNGLAQIWYVDDWSKLKEPAMWMAATGQIFFTLSLGLGMIHTYASYLKKKEDVTLNGLAACGTNEFVEIILGSTIAIPTAVIFFGAASTIEIAEGGTFSLGFFALPVIFQQMPEMQIFGAQIPSGQIFGTMWFVLLFLAGLTSSMAMFTPLLVFLDDELQIPKRVGVMLIAIGVFIMMQPIIFFMHHGIIDEVDFWMGDFGLVLFAAIEAILFCWIFGLDKGWKEMHLGADLQVPRIFYYIMKYVTPTFVIVLLLWYVIQYKGGTWTSTSVQILNWEVNIPLLKDGVWTSSLWNKIRMEGVPAEHVPYLWVGRGMILSLAAFLIWGVHYAWQTHPKFFEDAENKDDKETQV